MLKIYNSLSQEKEIFEPLQAGKVKMYVCGVTVYDYCHLGHGRMLSAFDVVTRYLRWRGYDVTYVRNITDIDDKIIKRANENNEDYAVLTDRFIRAMNEDITALKLLPPDKEPRATEYIEQMLTMIEQLLINRYAYIAENGDVYFDVRRFKNYGCLAHRDIDQLESGARVEISDVKRDPLDFVLWKIAKPGEPSWESQWGRGRPGWHIECSTMSTRLLGEHFDIHGGGKDLIFPHHENEIAQSEGATKQKFVNYWMHNGYVQIDKEKMSKSLGNFLTLRDLLQDHAPEVIRYFLIASHYRSPLHYAGDVLSQARSALSRLYNALRDLPSGTAPENSSFEQRFIEAMDDDFNTPVAFSVLFDIAHEIQRLRDTDLQQAAAYGALLKKLGDVVGLLQDDPMQFLQSGTQDTDIVRIEALITARNKARQEKDWAEADRIRKELSDMSIVLEDSSGTTTWKKL